MSILNMNIEDMKKFHPHIVDYLDSWGIEMHASSSDLKTVISNFDKTKLYNFNEDIFFYDIYKLFNKYEKLKKKNEKFDLEKITVIGGKDKSGNPENVRLELEKGDVVSVVGATGSGKSRLLADIEWLAQKDSPTERNILINSLVPNKDMRFSIEKKIVTQLSQNMNFVMDLSVGEFLEMHASSRGIEEKVHVIKEIIEKANELAGESFELETPLTSLSGGQSRALMIADTAYLSVSPIVLIDEIENAGIDRRQALNLLIKKEKIVLIATHDPILALMGDRRLVIKNGAISKIIKTSKKEKENLKRIEVIDSKFLALREKIRAGEHIEDEIGVG